MSGGEIAALIAAGAFVVLVLFLVIVLVKASKVLGEVAKTTETANHTIDVVTKDVNRLSGEVEILLSKTNELLTDVNGKVAKIDPLFAAIGEVGESLSDLNESSRELAGRVTGVTKRAAQMKTASKFGKMAMNIHSNRKAKKAAKQNSQTF